MNRDKVESMISIRLAQAVILSNHLLKNREPNEDYVTEKTTTYPSLDSHNQDSMNKIVTILEDIYELDIPRRSWG